MMAIFLRELRENAKWAAIIFLAFTAFAYTQIRRAEPLLLFELAEVPTIVFAPLAGLLMGFAGGLFETRPDNWAFVVHRPVSRRRIFAAKCLAGLLLTYISIETPFLLTALWAARPGHLAAPFQARMMLPTLAIAFCAGAYYFAGLTITLRRARWIGSRVLPLGLAIACSVAVRYSTEFWQAMACVAIVHALGAMGAWNAFATGGAADRRGAPAFALGAMIYVGALGIGCVLVGMLGIFQNTARWQQFRVDREGRVLRITWTLQNRERSCTITDSQGRAIAEYEGVEADDPAQADRFVRLTTLFDARQLPYPASMMMHGGYGSAVPGVSRLSSVAKFGVRVRSLCFYNMQRRIIEMYDPLTRVLVGTVGPAGFAMGQAAPTELFPADGLNMRFGGGHALAFTSAVYWLELDQRRVREVFKATADDPVISATEVGAPADPMLALATKTRVLVMRPTGEPLFSIPSEHDLAKHSMSLALIPAKQHLLVWTADAVPQDNSTAGEVREYASDGKLVRSERLAPLEEGGEARKPRTAAFGFFYPVAGLPIHRSWLVDYIFELDTLGHRRLFLGCLFAGSLLSAIGSVLLCRWYGFGLTKTIGWAATNLFLGVCGVAVLVSLYEWPGREACAVCDGRRLARRRECSKCGAATPPAQFDGREIFEPADAFGAVCT